MEGLNQTPKGAENWHPQAKPTQEPPIGNLTANEANEAPPVEPGSTTSPETTTQELSAEQIDRIKYKSQDLVDKFTSLNSRIDNLINLVPPNAAWYRPLNSFGEDFGPKIKNILNLIVQDNETIGKVAAETPIPNLKNTFNQLQSHWLAFSNQLEESINFAKRLERGTKELLDYRYDRDHPVWQLKSLLIKAKEEFDLGIGFIPNL